MQSKFKQIFLQKEFIRNGMPRFLPGRTWGGHGGVGAASEAAFHVRRVLWWLV